MLDIAAISIAFPELSDLAELNVSGGQKHVLTCEKGGCQMVLKIFKPEASLPERIEREIEAVRRLADVSSEYVPQIHESGEREVGGRKVMFLIEDFVNATSLRPQLAGGISVERSLDILESLLIAIHDFGQNALVHRDIKPENILVEPTGKVWVIDFGIVRVLDLPGLTATADRWGACTVGYAAQEQLRNMKNTIDSVTDLYSAGVVAHECLSGSHHFFNKLGADKLAIIQAMERESFPVLNIQGDDGTISGLIGELTSPYKSRRPQSADEALLRLQHARMTCGI